MSTARSAATKGELGTSGTEPAGGPRALARREAARRDAADPLARTITVALAPAEALERILDLGLDGLEPRSVAYDRRLADARHEGKVFYELTRDGVVLWRRPVPRWFRGALERLPYPDVLDVRIEPIARGSRIEMRWRAHPITRGALLWNAGWMAALWSIAIAAVASAGPTRGPLVLCLCMLVVSAQAAVRLVRARRLLGPVLPRAYAALAPYELGAGERQGSVFRMPSAGVLTSSSPSSPR